MDGSPSKEGRFILILGGSGYLGLHLLEALCCPHSPFRVAFTYHSHPPPPLLLERLPGVSAFKVDLVNGDGFDAIAATLGPPQVVVNCSALSLPRECEDKPSLAMAINVPNSLVQWLSLFTGVQSPFLIQLSTDQVYEGAKSFYTEEDDTNPVNVYGKSKVAAERFIQGNWSNYVILRSSIIYGPQPIIPVQKSLLVQWMDNILSNGKEVEFFCDEYRCPIFVKDVVKVIELLITKEASEMTCMALVLNLGGPDRLSRAEMAEVVANMRGLDKSSVKSVSAALMNRSMLSPPDISMNVNKLVSTLSVALTPFHVGVKIILSDDHT